MFPIPAVEYFSDLAGTVPAKLGDPIACMRVGTLTYEQPTLMHRPTMVVGPLSEPMPAFDGVDDGMYVTF